MSGPHIVRPGTLPTPFSAAEIRDATANGTTLVIRTTPRDGEPSFRRTTFVECDPDGALRSFVEIDGAGVEMGEVETAYSTWAELQGHAVFEASTATRTMEVRDTALGRFECIRYDASGDDGASVFWFAPQHPGMPVVYEMRGPDGDPHVVVEVIALFAPGR